MASLVHAQTLSIARIIQPITVLLLASLAIFRVIFDSFFDTKPDKEIRKTIMKATQGSMKCRFKMRCETPSIMNIIPMASNTCGKAFFRLYGNLYPSKNQSSAFGFILSSC